MRFILPLVICINCGRHATSTSARRASSPNPARTLTPPRPKERRFLRGLFQHRAAMSRFGGFLLLGGQLHRSLHRCNGRVQPPAAQATARDPESLLERCAVAAVLLRFKLSRRVNFHCARVHRTAANTALKAKDKGAYAARAIHPRHPERRGLSRTGVSVKDEFLLGLRAAHAS